jgi:hypothetical protein
MQWSVITKTAVISSRFQGRRMRTAIVSAGFFVAFLLAGCGIFHTVGPSRLAYSATAEIVNVSPTKVRVAGTITNKDTKPITVSYGDCSFGIRVTSKNAGPASVTYEVNPLTGVCSAEIRNRTLKPGEGFVLGEIEAVLTGRVPPGEYAVTALLLIKGNPEPSAGVIEVR